MVFSLESGLILLGGIPGDIPVQKALPWALRARNPKFCRAAYTPDVELQSFVQIAVVCNQVYPTRNSVARDGRGSLVNGVGCQELRGKTVLLGDDLVVCKSVEEI